ncbi:MAG TPA: hypothetical protein VME18_01975 [Acidobacteriaceae bacterium]|nr:hypothetical protein [Acidobacteriaceae bacterium]
MRFLAGLLPLALGAAAYAVSCTTESMMTAEERGTLEQTALALANNVKTGNLTTLKAQTLSTVAAKFSGIADSVQAVQPFLQHATLTADALYLLNAGDLTSTEEAQFICGVPGSALIVTLTIPSLPPGQYALAILHATGVEHPQQLSMMLSRVPGSSGWKLAGFFTRPMTLGGHDGVWFWRQARVYAAKKQDWNAWFYYQTAQYLLNPVDFLSSPNLERLLREAEDVQPGGLPGEQPMHLNGDGQSFDITNLHTGELAGQLDLVVDFRGTPQSDPVAARAEVTAVMRALLQQHPELASAFHGLWVYASSPGGQPPFALELPMSQIRNSASPAGLPSTGTNNSRKQAG